MRGLLLFCFLLVFTASVANSIFIPMDERQANHLKAYGIAYWILRSDTEVDWLLNYRGGSLCANSSCHSKRTGGTGSEF
jgi:hypothetical protein